jgi:alpha-tubulin suppressor-like RCC1 family protein
VSGAVYCWGYNAGGQAGDGTKEHAYEAVKVVGLPAPASQVKTTPDATCALLTSGKVYCWGTNLYGQLGNGLLKDPSPVPQEVVIP